MSAAHLSRLGAGVFTWSDVAAWDGRPGVTYARNGFVVTGDAGAVVLIDPPSLTPEVVAEIEELGAPSLVALTCAAHRRETDHAKELWHCTVVAPAGTEDADHELGAAPVAGRLAPVALAGVHWPDEVAFHVTEGAAVLIVGDALCGGRDDLGVADGDVGRFGAPRIPAAEAAETLRRLLELPFDVLAFGHGTPVCSEARAALTRFLDDLGTA